MESIRANRLNRRSLFALTGAATISAMMAGRSAAQDETPRQGGSLSFGLRVEPDTLDPHKTVSEYTSRVLTNVTDPLLWQTADLTFHPGLAESWEISEDGLTYTFQLRAGVTFQDGTPLTAEAAKFSFDRIVDPATASKSAIGALGPYASAEVLDELRFQLKLTEPFAPLLVNLTSPYLGLVSPKAVQEMGEDFSSAPVGAGPYRVKEWVRNDHITLERNPDYNWAPPFFTHQGPGYLDEIVFRVVPEGSTRLAALENGELQIIEYTPAQTVQRLNGDSNYQVHIVPRPGMPRALPINASRAPTDELAVRQAILYAIDAAVVNQTVNFGVNELAYGPLSPVTFGYDPAVESLYPFDPARAGQLLDEAGWIMGADGVREKDGQRLTLRYVIWAQDELRRIAESVQAQLSQVGIASEIEAPDYSGAVPIYVAGEHNLGSTGYVMTDPDVMSVMFGLDQIQTGLNKVHYKDPVLQDLLQEAAATIDPEARQALYSEAQKMVMDLALVKPLYQQTGITTATSALRGLSFNSSSYEMLYDAWLAQ